MQRLVIARAVLRQKKIWLLDEATSSLDLEKENKVLKNLILLAEKKDSILIAITHRLANLQYFDEIWFVNNGVILEKGTHSDLLKNESYKDFCQALL